MILTENQKKEFFEDGFLIIKSFYDIENEIYPIQNSIYQIIDYIDYEILQGKLKRIISLYFSS